MAWSVRPKEGGPLGGEEEITEAEKLVWARAMEQRSFNFVELCLAASDQSLSVGIRRRALQVLLSPDPMRLLNGRSFPVQTGLKLGSSFLKLSVDSRNMSEQWCGEHAGLLYSVLEPLARFVRSDEGVEYADARFSFNLLILRVAPFLKGERVDRLFECYEIDDRRKFVEQGKGGRFGFLLEALRNVGVDIRTKEALINRAHLIVESELREDLARDWKKDRPDYPRPE